MIKRNPFTEHPHHVGETYLEHMKFAGLFGCKMIMAGLACLTHAILPFTFKKTGSDLLLNMCEEFIKRMPKVEARVYNLSQSIVAKKQTETMK